MPRTFQDINDIVHGWLLGAMCAYTTWVYVNRAQYSSARLSRLNIVVSLVLIVRLMTAIRLETTSSGMCAIWIYLRSIITTFGVYGLNIYFTAELFLNVAVAVASKTSPNRRLWRFSVHGFTQALNLANGLQHATNVIPLVTPANFCALTGHRDSQPLAWMTMVSFFICLGMTITLAFTKTMFSATVPEFTQLFRILTVSSGLLCMWVTYAQLDMIYLLWDEWKTFHFTIMMVWMSVNSVIANNYLIRLRSRTRSVAKSLSRTGAGSGLGDGFATGNVVVPGSGGGKQQPSSGLNGGMVGTPVLVVPVRSASLSLSRSASVATSSSGQGHLV